MLGVGVTADMIGWKVREMHRELEEGGGSWGRKQEKKEAHAERKAEGKSGDKLETAAVKATQEAISRTPGISKVEQQYLHKRIGQKISRLMEISGVFLFPSFPLSLRFLTSFREGETSQKAR